MADELTRREALEWMGGSALLLVAATNACGSEAKDAPGVSSAGGTSFGGSGPGGAPSAGAGGAFDASVEASDDGPGFGCMNPNAGAPGCVARPVGKPLGEPCSVATGLSSST